MGAFLADRDLAYRHDHVPGEKAYFDFAGLTLRYQDGDRVVLAHNFTATLGWSNAIFACAYANETAESGLDGHYRAFVAFGRVTRIAVPDNPRALIAKADRFEPRLPAVYRDFARHHDVVVIPARVSKPKDKSPVEGVVKIVETHILASAHDLVFAAMEVLSSLKNPHP